MSHSASSRVKSNKGKQVTNGHEDNNKENKKEELLSSDDDDDDEPVRAPVQLKIEFVNSIMFRQWTLAKKLCHFMLMYEPNNNQAKQYAPLIDYMLAQEESSSSDDDDDTSDDDDDDDDSSDSSSSSSSNEEEKPDDTLELQSPKPINASLSNKCTHHNHK